MLKQIKNSTKKRLKKAFTSEKKKEYLRSYQKDYYTSHKRVTVTLNTYEYEALLNSSKLLSCKPSQCLKRLTLAYIEDKSIVSSYTKKHLEEFVFLIRNIANNINQISRHSNILKQVFNSKRVFENLKQLEQEVREFINDNKIP